MHAAGSDHPVFTRLSRAQQVARRRHVGFQALIFDAPPPPGGPSGSSRTSMGLCTVCQRAFSSVWKSYLCHVCGHWVCEPCSRVLERERVEGVVRFVRSCVGCLPMLNKWNVHVDELAAFTFAPWVVPSSVSPLGVNLAEVLRSRPDRRHAALSLLRHLGREVHSIAGVSLEEITEDEWAATASSSTHEAAQAARRSSSLLARGAQHFVQQCLDVRIPEVPLAKCELAEVDGRRSYPLTYDPMTESPLTPEDPKEVEREEWIKRYKLLETEMLAEMVGLICDLATKELECCIGVASVVSGDQHFMSWIQMEKGPVCNERKQSFCAHTLVSKQKPLLIRYAHLDVRFRNFSAVTGKEDLAFYFGVPILAGDGVVVATLCMLDRSPRKNITTMQYSVVTRLAEVLASMWQEAYEREAEIDALKSHPEQNASSMSSA